MIGETLAAKRGERGLSIDQVSASTRIRREHLQALEAEDFAHFSAPVYAKGYLRTYATYLGLDAEDLSRRMPAAWDRPSLALGLEKHERRPRAVLTTPAVAAAGLVLLAGMFGGYAWRQVVADQRSTAAILAPPAVTKEAATAVASPAIPVLMALLLLRFPGHDQVAAALFIAFSLTDTVDGQLARRSGSVSDLGKFLDPLADKLFVLAVLIVLVQEGLVAAWVVVVIFSRELIITILRSVGASQGRVIAAAPLGKTKTVTQMAAVTLLILQRPYPVLVPIAEIAVAAAVVFTLGSGLDYLWRFRYLLGPFDTSRLRQAPKIGRAHV